MGVEIESYLRVGSDHFVPIALVDHYQGDLTWLPGAIVLSIEGVEILSFDLWDDINWLWPFIINDISEYLSTGVGEGYFPDQPLRLRIERLGPLHTRVSVRGGDIHRQAVGLHDEFLEQVAVAGEEFFSHLRRLGSDSSHANERSLAQIKSWRLPGTDDS